MTQEELELDGKLVMDKLTGIEDPSIIRKYRLSEEYIREFHNKLDLRYYRKFEHLSEKFIIEFADKFSFNFILTKNDLSNDTIVEIIEARIHSKIINGNTLATIFDHPVMTDDLAKKIINKFKSILCLNLVFESEWVTYDFKKNLHTLIQDKITNYGYLYARYTRIKRDFI